MTIYISLSALAALGALAALAALYISPSVILTNESIPHMWVLALVLERVPGMLLETVAVLLEPVAAEGLQWTPYNVLDTHIVTS